MTSRPPGAARHVTRTPSRVGGRAGDDVTSAPTPQTAASTWPKKQQQRGFDIFCN